MLHVTQYTSTATGQSVWRGFYAKNQIIRAFLRNSSSLCPALSAKSVRKIPWKNPRRKEPEPQDHKRWKETRRAKLKQRNRRARETSPPKDSCRGDTLLLSGRRRMSPSFLWRPVS